MAATYDKDTDYQKLIDEATAAGDYYAAAQYEQQRNAKITGEGIDAPQTSQYTGNLDTTDYGVMLRNMMDGGASADEVSSVLGQRVDKANSAVNLEQYAYDDIYKAAMDYINGGGSGTADFTYEDAPSYTNKYEDKISTLLDSILGREDFSYDYTQDPLYNQYEETYTREGNRAMQDTLGQVSARTGGLASSYATSAATQANNYYMQQLADKIPELQQLAYSMYKDKGDTMYQNIDLLQALEQGDYQKFQDILQQFNIDRDFDYGVYSDDKAWDYTKSRDEVEDSRYADETSYNRSQDDYDKSLYQAQLLAETGDFSGFEALGFTPEQIAELEAYYKAQDTKSGSTSGRSSSSRSSNSGSRSTSGIVDSMLEFDNDTQAYEYLISKGYTVSVTEQLWELYQNSKGSSGGSGGFDPDLPISEQVTNTVDEQRNGTDWIAVPGIWAIDLV